jgi:isoleucyl-tRNA synthetase
VLTHGFFVDEAGRKMSKSIGNTIEPQEVIEKSGAEIIRLWTAMVDYREEMRVGPDILARVVEAYRKLRNTCRILAANLYDFDPAVDRVPVESLEPVDRYMLSRFAEVGLRALASYEAFEFQGVVHGLSGLATVDLSAFYVDVSKDRLYTLAAGSPSRRSAQTVMFHVVDGLARLIAPILPVTAEQLWKALPGAREQSAHLADFPSAAELQEWRDETHAADWEQLLSLRNAMNVEIEARRKEKVFGTSLGAAARIVASGGDLALLRKYESSLPTLFIVSSVEVDGGPDGVPPVLEVRKADGVKCERCWRIVPSVTGDPGREGLCDRCVEALAEPVGS